MKKITIDSVTLKMMYPDRDFADRQLMFFNEMINKLETDRDTEKVTVFPSRCGIGKSTAIQLYLQRCMQNNTGAIVVTDSISRLNTLKDGSKSATDWDKFITDNDKYISLLTAANVREEITRQRYKPILMLTTQRYFQMDVDALNGLLPYEWQGEKSTRKIIIFDEQPYFYDVVNFGIKELNLLDSALNEGITDRCPIEDKKWILEQMKAIDLYFRDVIDRLEYSRNVDTYLYWHDRENAADSMTEDDSRFYAIIRDNMDDIRKHYPQTEKLLRLMHRLFFDGGFFKSSKITTQQSRNTERMYEKTFFLIDDYREKLLLNPDVKTFIFDGTANTSYLYFDESFFDIVDCDEYNVPLNFLNINIINVNTSKNALLFDNQKDAKIGAITDYVKRKQLSPEDTLFVTYQKLLSNDTFADVESKHKNYFGNLRGFNDYADTHNYIQVGLNRRPDIDYILMLFYTQPEYYEYAKVRYYKGDCMEWFDNLRKSDDAMYSELASDTIQNIYRTAARNYTNTEPVNVYLFFDVKLMSGVIDDLKYEFERYDATINIEELPQLAEVKAKARQSSRGQTNVQKILSWIDGLPIGQLFTNDDICSEVGISKRQLNNAKHDSKVIKERLGSLKLPGTSKYRK